MKDGKTKEKLIEDLKKIPIVQMACERTGIARATFYRWRKEDRMFAKAADDALEEGALFINDMAESKLIVAIKDANLGAITYWLKHHHAAYTNKLEIIAQKGYAEEKLTPHEQKVVEQALLLAKGSAKQNEEKN